MPETKTMPVADVHYEADLYPRFEPRDSVVRQYAEQIDALPPIEVNQNDILIDGWHRWTAHKLAERETIKVRVVETETKAELLALAVERNAKHGIQLTGDEKRAYAVRIWSAAPVAERAAVEKRLQKTLSVGKTFIREALADVKRARREENHRNAARMWLACHSNRAIGEAVGIDEGTVRKFAADGKIPQCLGWETHPDFDEEGFKPPYWNVWAPKTRPFEDHVDALLWFCTDPGDVVIDPFAGSTPTMPASGGSAATSSAIRRRRPTAGTRSDGTIPRTARWRRPTGRMSRSSTSPRSVPRRSAARPCLPRARKRSRSGSRTSSTPTATASGWGAGRASRWRSSQRSGTTPTTGSSSITSSASCGWYRTSTA